MEIILQFLTFDLEHDPLQVGEGDCKYDWLDIWDGIPHGEWCRSHKALLSASLLPANRFSNSKKRESRFQSFLGFVCDPWWLSLSILHQRWFQRNYRKAVSFLRRISLENRSRLNRYLNEHEKTYRYCSFLLQIVRISIENDSVTTLYAQIGL